MQAVTTKDYSGEGENWLKGLKNWKKLFGYNILFKPLPEGEKAASFMYAPAHTAYILINSMQTYIIYVKCIVYTYIKNLCTYAIVFIITNISIYL